MPEFAAFRSMLKKGTALLAGLGLIPPSPAALEAGQRGLPGKPRPNFIFILIDDLGWQDLACYGSTFYETPNLDALAAAGIMFTDAYASCPVCSPTRASILTGKYPATVGITEWIGGNNHGKLLNVPYLRYLPHEEKTLASALSEAGYRTWHVGKWHLGGKGSYPEDHGFEVNIGGCEFGWPPGGYFSPYKNPKLADGPQGECLTDRLTSEAIDLLSKKSDRPFFLNLWYYAVHTPIQGKPELVEKYRKKAERMGLDKIEPFREGENFPCLEKKHKRITRRTVQSDPVYAAMIENLDMNIGRLLSALAATGQSKNTVVVFYSDNGGLSTAEGSPTTNKPLNEGKGWMYEGGTREPLIVRWPGEIKPGSKCAVPVTSTDFYPTFLEIAGLPFDPQQHCDGASILPLLKGGNSLDREAIFWHYPHYSNQGGTPGCSVRSGDYKLIEFFEDGRLELYNLRSDIEEKHNLARWQPEVVRKLHRLLADWRAGVRARIPHDNPDYEREKDSP